MADAAQNAISSLVQNRSATPSNVNVRENGGWLFKVEWWPGKREKLPYGTVPADGQLVNRAMFPGFTKGIVAGVVPVVEDSVFLADPTQRGCYTLGDGSTTVRVPDYNGKLSDSLAAVMLRGDGKLSGGAPGAMQRDALQNITGVFGDVADISNRSYPLGINAATGAFAANSPDTGYDAGDIDGNQQVIPNSRRSLSFDASRVARTATETRPFNVTGCWVIRAFGIVKNEAAFDVASIMAQLAKINGFGLGASNSAAAPFLANVDATDTASGFYYANLDSAGIRPAGYGMVRVERYPTTDNISQTWRCPGNINNGAEYQRTYNVSTGVWLPWAKVYNNSEDSAWILPTLQNGWVQYSTYNNVSTWADAAYRQKFNEVQLRGLVKNPSNQKAGTTIFTLPAGYRPPRSLVLVTDGDGLKVRIDVSSNGEVVMNTDNIGNNYVSLDPVRFSLRA